MLTQELEPLSPLKMDFPDPKFATGNDLNRTEEVSTHFQPESVEDDGHDYANLPPKRAEVSSPDYANLPPKSTDGGIEMRQKELKSHSLAGSARYQEHDRGSWVNIKLVKGRNSVDSVLDPSRDSHGELRPEDRGKMVGSLDRVSWEVMEGRSWVCVCEMVGSLDL